MQKEKRPKIKYATKRYEEALTKREGAGTNKTGGKYILKLYITGMTPRSQEALRNIQKVCREHLADNYELEVIDIYQQPTLAKGDQIIAVPTLIKKLPVPLRRMIGDLSQEDRIIMGLDIKPNDPNPAPMGRRGEE
jgi:circadian clock protein KaiB